MPIMREARKRERKWKKRGKEKKRNRKKGRKSVRFRGKLTSTKIIWIVVKHYSIMINILTNKFS